MSNRGLTFVEMLVTVSIFAIVMIAIVESVRFFYRANTTAIEQSYQIDSARRGVEFLVRDVREARQGENGAHPIQTIGSTSIAFFSDTDADALVERIAYTLTGTTLFRHVVEPAGDPPDYSGLGATTTVSLYVRNEEEGAPLFRYFDAEGAEIVNYTSIGDVQSVSVSLIVNILPIRAPEEFTLRSSATLRNVRNE